MVSKETKFSNTSAVQKPEDLLVLPKVSFSNLPLHIANKHHLL